MESHNIKSRKGRARESFCEYGQGSVGVFCKLFHSEEMWSQINDGLVKSLTIINTYFKYWNYNIVEKCNRNVEQSHYIITTKDT